MEDFKVEPIDREKLPDEIKELRKYLVDKMRGIKIKVDSEDVLVNFSNRGINELTCSLLMAYKGHLKAAAARYMVNDMEAIIKTGYHLADLLKDASIYEYNPNYKENKKKDRVVGYETYVVPITINGNQRKAKIVVELRQWPKQKKPSRGYYYHFLESTEKKELQLIIHEVRLI